MKSSVHLIWYWPLAAFGTLIIWYLARWFGQRFAKQDDVEMPPWHDWIWLGAVAIVAGSYALHSSDGTVRVVMTAYLLLTAWVDRWTGYIPDTAHLVAVPLIIGIRLVAGTFSWWSLASGLLLGLAVMVLGMIVSDGIGGGDIKLSAVMGLALGFVVGGGVFWAANVLALGYALGVRLVSHRIAAVRMGPWFLISYALALTIPVSWLPGFLDFLAIR